MPRPANEAAEAACRDAANHGLPTADLARLTGISHRTLSDVRGRLVEAGEIPQPPNGRGHPLRGGSISITVAVPAQDVRDLDRHAEDEGTDRSTLVREAITRELRRRAIEESARESMREDGRED